MVVIMPTGFANSDGIFILLFNHPTWNANFIDWLRHSSRNQTAGLLDERQHFCFEQVALSGFSINAMV
jgi:hypothetical protein